jgi:hypothetical protein
MAEAFQGPEDDVPVRFYYKGSLRRKIADKDVIKVVGKIYEVKKRLKTSRGGELCGKLLIVIVCRRGRSI